MDAAEQLKEHSRKPMARKPRVVSMPPALNRTGSSSVYSTRTSRFSGAGSPPIIDFTEWADNYRGQRFGLNVIHEFPIESTNVGIHTLLTGDNDAYSDGWRIRPEVLLDALRSAVESQGDALEKYLDPGMILDLRRRDRECAIRLSQGSGTPNIDGVIGKPLIDVFIHASLPLTIAGEEHLVPTLVVKCVDELYRTGLYQPQLFRKTPNFGRVEHLVEVYDHFEQPSHIHIARRRSRSISHYSSITAFGAQTSLHMETTENICALLRTFLQYLPEPILSPCLFEAIWNWCDIRQEVSRVSFDEFSPQGSMSMVRAGSGISSEELRHIHTAQLLLHLLPTPNFSLLIYLLSFFSQVVMVSEENGLAVEDVGSMFGSIFFGGHTEGRKNTKVSRGNIMLRWFLQRWKQIYNGLLPHDDDRPTPKSKINGKSSSTIQAPDDFSNANKPTPGYVGESALVREEPGVHSAAKGHSLPASSMLPRPPNGLPAENIAPTNHQRANRSFEEPTLKYLEDVWPHLTPELRMKLNERLLDVLLEPLLTSDGPKMARRRSNSVPTRFESLPSSYKPPPLVLQRQSDSSKGQVTHLERVIQESQRLLQETWNENDRLRQGKDTLETQVEALQAELKLYEARCKDNEKKLRRELEGKVKDIVKQRDRVRDVVQEIQRISGSVKDGAREWN